MKLAPPAEVTRVRRSLPTRERELKRRRDRLDGGARESLPTRERELKHRPPQSEASSRSLPTRERELKRQLLARLLDLLPVAPYTGA